MEDLIAHNFMHNDMHAHEKPGWFLREAINESNII